MFSICRADQGVEGRLLTVSRELALPCLWVLRIEAEPLVLTLKPEKPRDAAAALHAVRRRCRERGQSSIGVSKSEGAGPFAVERGLTKLSFTEP